MLQPVKIFRRDEDEKSEQNHGREVRAHDRAMIGSAAILFEFREVEQAQDVVGARIINVMSVVPRSLSKRYDIAPDVWLIGPHLAPRMIISVAIAIPMPGLMRHACSLNS